MQVQFLYAMAILLSVPLQLFPAVRIMENGIFKRSGKMDTKVKWQKNIFRFIVVAFCAGLSWAGAADLDKFVAFVGSFAWYVLALTIHLTTCSTNFCYLPLFLLCSVPLCYVYPAMLHYKACARTRKQKIADIALMVFGLWAAAYTTIMTVRVSCSPQSILSLTWSM